MLFDVFLRLLGKVSCRQQTPQTIKRDFFRILGNFRVFYGEKSSKTHGCRLYLVLTIQVYSKCPRMV